MAKLSAGCAGDCQALPKDHGCLAERGLSKTQLSLRWNTLLKSHRSPYRGTAGKSCEWLLVSGNDRHELAARVLNGHDLGRSTPGQRSEKFRILGVPRSAYKRPAFRGCSANKSNLRLNKNAHDNI